MKDIRVVSSHLAHHHHALKGVYVKHEVVGIRWVLVRKTAEVAPTIGKLIDQRHLVGG